MSCDELRSDYLLYAMGTIEEPEATEMRAHLERGCATCAAGIREARVLAHSMGATVDGPAPPRHLRRHVLAIGGRGSGTAAGWRLWALAAACLIVALAPAFLWYRQSLEWKATEAETASRLHHEESVAASLRERVAKLENAPVRAVPIFALELVRGGGGEHSKELAIPPGTSDVVLAFPTEQMREASVVELRNSSEQTVWSVALLPAGQADSAGLTIPAKLLTPGAYQVLLRAGERTVGRLPFRVTAGK